jgi:hypothetical protein
VAPVGVGALVTSATTIVVTIVLLTDPPHFGR